MKRLYFIVCLFVMASNHASTADLNSDGISNIEYRTKTLTSIEKCKESSTPANGTSLCFLDNRPSLEGWICVATCKTGFYFPGGEIEVTGHCNRITGQWLPLNQFQSCSSKEEVLANLYKNHCWDMYRPKNGRFYCLKGENFDFVCYVGCNNGYEFPDGKTSVQYVCDVKTGHWGTMSGQYDSPNCQKKETFLRIQDCSDISAPANGSSECLWDNSPEFQGWRCDVWCNEGLFFPTAEQTATTHCDRETNKWLPLQDCSSMEDVRDKLYQIHCRDTYNPQNGVHYCRRWDHYNLYCYGQCNVGYEFPNGEIMEHVCDVRTGLWGAEGLPYSSPACKQKEDLLKIQNCTGSPTPPVNGSSKCFWQDHHSFQGWRCEASCKIGFLFPTGEDSATIDCDTETNQWLPNSHFEDCLGEEEVFDNLHRKNCLVIYYPKNGRLHCQRTSKFESVCYVECNHWFVFPNGETKLKLVCYIKTGYWDIGYENSAESERYSLPEYYTQDCKSTQETDFGEDEASERLHHKHCWDTYDPTHGMVTCREGPNYEMYCYGTCIDGYQFPDELERVRNKCDVTTGLWESESGLYISPKCEPIP